MLTLSEELKVKHADEFLRCLVEIDVRGIRKLLAHAAPNSNNPTSDKEALYTIHLARTASKRIPLQGRLYSTAWLKERGIKPLTPT